MTGLDIKWTTLERVLNELADTFIQEARDNLQADGSIATGELYDSFEKIVETIRINERDADGITIY